MLVYTGACTYDRFETRVGEPRGVEYRQVSGSQTGLLTADWFTRPFDWFIDRSDTVLLSLGHCSTEFRTLFY